MIDEEFAKFLADVKPAEAQAISAMKHYFHAYLTDQQLRAIIEGGDLTKLYTHPSFTIQDYKAVPKLWREKIPNYIKDYISLNQFMV